MENIELYEKSSVYRRIYENDLITGLYEVMIGFYRLEGGKSKVSLKDFDLNKIPIFWY